MAKFEVVGNPQAVPVFEELQGIGRELGISLFLGGGSLRDYFMRKYHGAGSLERDFDIYVESGLNQVVSRLRGRFGEARITRHNLINGIPFVEIVFPETRLTLHFNTLRGKAGRYKQGQADTRKILHDHALQADFTINSMFLDLRDLNRPLRVFDPLNGREAVRERVVKATNTGIFRLEQSEHALLRAVSMAQYIGGRIDPETVRLIRRDAAMIQRSRPYRVKRELERILRGPNAERWIGFLKRAGVLGQIFPRMRSTAPHNLKRNLARKFKPK